MSDRSAGHVGTALRPTGAANPTLVGRQPELVRLRAAFEAASAGAPNLVLLAGEAGIGKSRLLAELSQEVEDTGGRVMTGACLDLADGGLPLLPLAEALRELARRTPFEDLERMVGPMRTQLVRLVPALGKERTDGDEPLVPARMAEAVLAILGGLAADRPTMLAFEDVHWIDRASRDLVTFLARNLAAEPLLLVLTCRTDDLEVETDRWLGELGRQPRVERIELRRLGREAVREQLTALTGVAPDPGRLERTWRRSDGNPYFVEELVAAGEDDAPPTLTASLTGRLAVLSPPTREIVRIAALGGRSIDEALLVAVADRPVSEVRSALREAVERRVLSIADEGRIGFRHALVREVAAGELLAGERRELHQRLASVLAERTELAEPSPAGAAAELAFHWEAAGRPSEALAAALDAGAAAARVAAWADADRQYERAIRLSGSAPLPAGTDLVDLLRRAAEAAELSGDAGRAETLIDRAIAAAPADGIDAERVALLHGRRGYLRWTRGDNEGSLAAYEQGLALLSPEPPRAARARILGSLASALFGLGRYDEASRTASEGVATAESATAPAEEARARNVLGSVLVARGAVAEGIAQLERSAELAVEAGPSDMRVVGPYNLAVNLAMAGRLSEAQDAAARGVEAARREGLQRRYGMDLAALEGDVLTRMGRWPDAETVMDDGLALDPSGQGTIYLATARGRLDALRGDVADARRRFAIAATLAEGRMDADLAGYLARARAEAALVDGDARSALEIAREGLLPLEGVDDHFVRSPLMVLAIQAAADVADGARAAHDAGAVREVRKLVAGHRKELERFAESAPMVAALRAHARAEGGRLDGTAALAPWTDAADRFAAIPDPHGAAYARYRAAEAALRREGVKADVGSLLRDAAADAERLGAAPLHRSIQLLARRARVSTEASSIEPFTAPAPKRAGGLSARELEVLRLVADGRSNGEIGDALFISRKTAGVHVTHILDKLGVTNRVEAAMAASRLGLLDDADAAGQ